MATIFDLILAATLLLLAWRVLAAPDLFEAVVLFITFGLLAAVAWARLAAPDIALAEAAIGAGLTGVLLLDTLRALSRAPAAGVHQLPARKIPAVLATCTLGGLLVWAVLQLPREAGGLTSVVAAEIPRSGVTHPVTAVLLNFRSYDTWLELGVLLVAVIGVFSMRRSAGLAQPVSSEPGAILLWLVRWLAPLMVLVAGYLLWLGKFAAGGAFQSGVVLGAIAVLLWLAGTQIVQRESLWNFLLVLGFVAFLLVAVAVMIGGNWMLQYPVAWAGDLIMLIETAAAVSIGATMAALFIALHFPEEEVHS
jgi:multisubunit Na+/H+ antiporter MnhB subunit